MKKHGRFFPATDTEELDKALQAFKASQERYENAERKRRAAVENGQRVSQLEVELLEREYFHAAIFAANVMLGQKVLDAQTEAVS